MNTAGTVALATLSGVGLLLSLLTLSISLVAVQAMSGTESLIELLLFFCGSFAISFGVAAACTLPWHGAHGPLQQAAPFPSAARSAAAFRQSASPRSPASSRNSVG
jgi:hypothetical protein